MGALRKLTGRAGAAEWFDGLQSFGLTVLLFGLPFSEALKSLGLALAALGFIVKIVLGRRPALRMRGAPAALILYFSVAALSVAVADPAFRHPRELLSLAMTLVPFVLVTDACARRSRRLFFVLAIVFGAALATVLGFLEPRQGSFRRLVLGSIENAVPAAEYLSAVVMLAVAMFAAEFRARVWGPLWALAAGLSGLGLVMTKSSGPLAGAIVGLSVTVGTALKRPRAVLAVLLVAVLVIVGFGLANPESRLGNPLSPGGRPFGLRPVFWSMSLERVLERPVLGHGQGTYRLLNLVYSGRTEEFHLSNAHNTWLHAACETGVMGAGTLALFVVLGLAGVLRACRRTRGLERAISVGALGGLVALLVASLFSVVTDAEPGMLFFTLMALGGAAPREGRETEGGADGR